LHVGAGVGSRPGACLAGRLPGRVAPFDLLQPNGTRHHKGKYPGGSETPTPLNTPQRPSRAGLHLKPTPISGVSARSQQRPQRPQRAPSAPQHPQRPRDHPQGAHSAPTAPAQETTHPQRPRDHNAPTAPAQPSRRGTPTHITRAHLTRPPNYPRAYHSRALYHSRV
jgi:hypothetical protein